jgi:hypothetical protein
MDKPTVHDGSLIAQILKKDIKLNRSDELAKLKWDEDALWFK